MGNQTPDIPDTLAIPDAWAAPDDMALWRDEVKKRGEARLAECPTAKRCMEVKDPETAAKGLYLLSTGEYSQNKIAKFLGIHRMELSRLAWHNSSALEQKRKELSVKFTHLADEQADILQQKIDQLRDDPEALEKTSIRDLVIGMGVAADKGTQYAGMATTIVEHRSGPSVEDFEAIKEAARKRLEKKSVAVDAEVVSDENPRLEKA